MKSHKLEKAFVSIILQFAFIICMLAGCGSSYPKPTSIASLGAAPRTGEKEATFEAPSDDSKPKKVEENGKITIRIATWYQEEYLGNLKSYLTRTFSDVTFEFVYIDKNHYESIIDSQLSYREAPDILYVDQGMARKHALTRYITPLTDITQEFNRYSREAFAYGNEIYAVPNTSSYKCLYYNKGLFEKYGLKVPQSYEEFLENAVYIRETLGMKVCSAALKDYANISESAQAFLQASYFDTEEGSYFGERLVYGRASFYNDLYPYLSDWEKLITYEVFRPEMYTMDQKAAIQEFANEETFILAGGPEDYNRIKVANPDISLGTMPFCGTADGTPILIGGCDCGFAVNTYGDHRQLSKEIVTSLASAEGQRELWNDRVGSMSYLKGLTIANPDTFDGIEQALKHKGLFMPYYSWGENCDNINMILGKELQRVLLGKETTNMALMQVDIKVKKLLKDE